MQELPHRYSVTASARGDSLVRNEAAGLPALDCAPPAEYGGPGDQWSPETLLVAAVADCFVLTFRAIATASKLEWTALECSVDGTLDKVDGATRFTELQVKARLNVPAGVNADRARRLLERAEKTCLITSSLKAETHLDAEVEETAG